MISISTDHLRHIGRRGGLASRRRFSDPQSVSLHSALRIVGGIPRREKTD
jgi:hypothetical protein